MAKVKISDLDPAATLDGTELVELEQGGESVRCTTQDIADLGGGGSSYLKYVALLSQTGTDDPVATVLENTLGGTVVWSFSGTGAFTATLAGAFTSNKTTVFAIANSDQSAAFTVAYETPDEDTVSIHLFNDTAAATNQFGGTVEIRVYP